MKQTFGITNPAFPLVFALAMLLNACAIQKETEQLGKSPGPVYDTAEEIQAMIPCEGVVAQRGPCFVYLSTTGGRGFYVGSPGSNAEVGRFLAVLKDGRAYRFPEAFLEYQEQRRQAEQ